MSNKLTEICDQKRQHVAICKAQYPEARLQELIAEQSPTRGFAKALMDAAPLGLIAEIKKASPSKGLIRADFAPASHAMDYAEGGATCLSVLTDSPYFQGEDAYLREARAACSLPVLRKDFMVDSYQVTEARAIGADCILIIMAALSDAQASELEAAALALGMDVLVEVHDEEELERAVTHLQSPLLGVNNRNLKTLEVSLENGKRLAKLAPKDKLLICESGIFNHDEVEEMQAHGFGAFLVGESLMRQEDIASATHSLLGRK